MKIRIQQFYTLKIASGDNPSGSKTSAVARLAVWNRNTLNLKFLSVPKNWDRKSPDLGQIKHTCRVR